MFQAVNNERLKMILRPYQERGEAGIYQAWDEGHINIMPVFPTGGGKTVIFAKMMAEHYGRSLAVAHRQELVGQISLALAELGVYHRILAPVPVVKFIVDSHIEVLGKMYYDPNSSVAVGGVDTILARRNELASWLHQVTLWVHDEGHHILKDNKFGRCLALMPKAKGIAPTATPCRADGKGLGRHADGIIDKLVLGPTGRELINDGYLTDYFIRSVDTPGLDLSKVGIGAKGDFLPKALKAAMGATKIVGSVVETYLEYNPGQLGVTFCPNVESAIETAKAFSDAGVPAAMVCGKTPAAERARAIKKFRNRELMQLTNVDLFGEGFDLPAIEVVSMERPTESFAVFSQEFGRMLRLMLEGSGSGWDHSTRFGRLGAIAASRKARATLNDHVGNCLRHGLPDGRRVWTLDRAERRKKGPDPDVIPTRVCLECAAIFERLHKSCPYCGWAVVPEERSGPEHVDGDLVELDAATMAMLRGEVEHFDRDPEVYRAELAANHSPIIGQMANVKRFAEAQGMQAALRASIAWWAGVQRSQGRTDSESYKLFYWRFGIDVMTAQTLKKREAGALADAINSHIGGVTR